MPDCKIQNPTVTAQENCPSNRKLPQPVDRKWRQSRHPKCVPIANQITLLQKNYLQNRQEDNTLSSCQEITRVPKLPKLQIRSPCLTDLESTKLYHPPSENYQSCIKSDPSASRVSNQITLLQRSKILSLCSRVTKKITPTSVKFWCQSKSASHCTNQIDPSASWVRSYLSPGLKATFTQVPNQEHQISSSQRTEKNPKVSLHLLQKIRNQIYKSAEKAPKSQSVKLHQISKCQAAPNIKVSSYSCVYKLGQLRTASCLRTSSPG